MMHSLLSQQNIEAENLSRRERRNLQQRAEILQTAVKLFSEKRYHNVSMHDIALEAEFGMGTLYKLFSNKAELYKALILETAEKWHQTVLNVLEQERNPVRAIEEYISIHRELFFDNLQVVRLYFAETQGARIYAAAGLDKDLHRFHDDRLKKLASVFKRGIERGVFRGLDHDRMVLTLEGIVSVLVLWINEDPAKFQNADDLSGITDIFLRGVLKA